MSYKTLKSKLTVLFFNITQKIILNKNYANNSIYKETNALNTLIVGKNTVGTNIEIGKAYNKH